LNVTKALLAVVTDAELVCLAVAQVLLRYDDERHWLRAPPARVGNLLPRMPRTPRGYRRADARFPPHRRDHRQP
jgi:hypothetical protein